MLGSSIQHGALHSRKEMKKNLVTRVCIFAAAAGTRDNGWRCLLLQECVYHQAVMDKKSPGTLVALLSAKSQRRFLLVLLIVAGVRVAQGCVGQEEPRHSCCTVLSDA
jgi:hypothetical protein